MSPYTFDEGFKLPANNVVPLRRPKWTPGRRNHRRGYGPYCMKVACEMTDRSTGEVLGEVAGFSSAPDADLGAAVWRNCEVHRGSESRCSPPRTYCVSKGRQECKGEIVFSLEKVELLLRRPESA